MMNDQSIQIFTIGFAGSNAAYFFERLRSANVKKVIDTRLWASSQLAGFARKKDMPYFLKNLVDINYEYRDDLAPTNDILKAYKNKKITWAEYETQYINLIQHRNIDHVLSPDEVNQSCFLCACQTHHHCHRRLLSEFLKDKWDTPISIAHL